jgi:hypothetical protein
MEVPMEIYLVVPDDLEKIYSLYEQCRQLFSRQRERVFIHSSFNEKCIGVAREIALRVGISFSVDPNLDGGGCGIKEFTKKHRWPTHCAQIFVVQPDNARAVAKFLDPGCASDAIPIDVLFRLKDVEVLENPDKDV